MLNTELKDFVTRRILPRVIQPAQYVGGELNMVRKDHRTVRGKLCLAFPDMYTIGMSHHGLQVLYTLMNSRDDWVCERAFTPGLDMEAELRRHGKPLYSLETFTPLAQFDVLGFTLQYEICTSNLLTMLDLGGIPLREHGAHAGSSAGDRRRPVCAESRADRAVYRSVRHRRRRAELAADLR